jgi:hypothetical protein
MSMNPEHGQQLSKSKATEAVRREVRQCASQQGGTTPESGASYSRPKGDATDMADGGSDHNANGDGMGRAASEWRYRDDQDDPYMDY